MRVSIFVACLCLCTLAACGPPPEPVGIGSRAPAFDLPALDGGRLASETLAGQPVVLNFWATWCLPCRKEFPVLKEMDADPAVEVVAIALDEEGASVVEPFAAREGLDYTILIGNQQIFERYNGFAIPYTVVLDRDLEVVSQYRGPATFEELDRDLRAMSADTESEASPQIAAVSGDRARP